MLRGEKVILKDSEGLDVYPITDISLVHRPNNKSLEESIAERPQFSDTLLPNVSLSIESVIYSTLTSFKNEINLSNISDDIILMEEAEKNMKDKIDILDNEITLLLKKEVNINERK